MQNSFLSKLQPHTIHIYGLDSIEDYSILKIKARELLNYKRFDLFAKLYYIHNRHNNFEDAKIYWQEQFNYIMVDEVQDCSRSDWKIIDILSQFYNNLLAEILLQLHYFLL